jgi:hypothetical protein
MRCELFCLAAILFMVKEVMIDEGRRKECRKKTGVE